MNSSRSTRTIGMFVAVMLGVTSWTDAQDDVITIDSLAGGPGTVQTLSITLSNDAVCQGWSVGVTHDPSRVTLLDAIDGADAQALQGGTGPAFSNITIYPTGFTSGVVISFLGGVFLPEGDFELYEATYELGEIEGVTSVEFTDELGTPPVSTVIVHAGASIVPEQVSGSIDVGVSFIRGDCNDDQLIDIADVIYVEQFLFLSGEVPACQSACDCNDDSLLDIADSITLLSWLFIGGAEPPPPFDACGDDPTSDSITCASTSAICP